MSWFICQNTQNDSNSEIAITYQFLSLYMCSSPHTHTCYVYVGPNYVLPYDTGLLQSWTTPGRAHSRIVPGQTLWLSPGASGLSTFSIHRDCTVTDPLLWCEVDGESTLCLPTLQRLGTIWSTMNSAYNGNLLKRQKVVSFQWLWFTITSTDAVFLMHSVKDSGTSYNLSSSTHIA